MQDIKENILATLAYFDLFNYPLNRQEIWLFLKMRCATNEFDAALKGMTDDGLIYQFSELYSLKDNAMLAIRRYNGNKKAAQLIAVAKKISSLLIRFPYVRGIAISGSLSKNFADEKSDIDLFIITKKNRLWIARTIMHAFKKLTFLVNKQDYFCMNYYIDEQQLEIVEKTIYTAIEIVTLIPLHGDQVFEQFYKANRWTLKHLPNHTQRPDSVKQDKNPFYKRCIEKALNNTFGDQIDTVLMKITGNRWMKKTILKKLNSKGNIMGMRVSKHYAKPDPKNFQKPLLQEYDHKVFSLSLPAR